MEPSKEVEAGFFIADRLRGIPLVSGGRRRKDLVDEVKSEGKNGTTVDAGSSTPVPISTRKFSLAQMVKSPSVTNDRAQLGEQTGRPTDRPQKPKPTTTNQPKKQTTITRRAQTQRPNSRYQTSDIRAPQSNKHKPSSSTAAATTMKPNHETRSTTRKLDTNRPIVLGTEQVAIVQGPNVSKISLDSSGTRENIGGQLNRANQTMMKEFDYQRRNPQTVSTPRFTNKPAEVRGPGENWILFNRNDGRMSAFEVLVLISNIMIVSTIVFIMLFSWFKSLRKKRSSAQDSKRTTDGKQQQRQPQPQPQQPAAVSPNGSKASTIAKAMDKTSELTRSMMGSALSGKSTGGESQVKTPLTGVGMATKSSPAVPQTSTAVKMDEVRVGSSHDITSEVRGGANSVANKAMAIVQPTENTDAHLGAFSDTEKLANAIKEELAPKELAMKRSASDMSDGKRAMKAPELATTAASMSDSHSVSKQPESSSNQVKALEQLFNSQQMTAAAAGDGSGGKRDKVGKSPVRSSSQISAGSLESIELPEPLVESIKRSDQPATEAPSPNLLLGEKDVNPGELPAQAEPMAQTTAGSGKSSNRKEQDKSEAAQRTDKAPTEHPNQKSRDEPKQPEKSPGKEEASAKQQQQQKSERPANPMYREEPTGDMASGASADLSAQARVNNHQVVVNKLDKRKTNLEIVDLRDESVTGKMRDKNSGSANGAEPGGGSKSAADDSAHWISMDGVAVVQPAASAVGATNQAIAQQAIINQAQQQLAAAATGGQHMGAAMSPSEIIESRFRVDYGSARRRQQRGGDHKESQDSKSERESLANIEAELELVNNKLRNRKYFVYIVNDGHFTAKKECIARIELPPKRRITLAEMRQLITNSQDISLLSLRRNKFKFVTETYRLLNENEDAAVLHQVYPTQGVFLKLNVPEQEGQAYQYKGGRGRLSSGAVAVGGSSSLAQTTIASRRRAATTSRRAPARPGSDQLPAIEVVNYANPADDYPRSRAASVGRRGVRGAPKAAQQSAYRRSKSSVQAGDRTRPNQRAAKPASSGSGDKLPSIGRFQAEDPLGASEPKVTATVEKQSLTSAATDLGSNVLSGAKRLFNATFNR